MQPALSTPFAQPPIPAWGELSENSRLGFTNKNPALYLGHHVSKSTTALGFQASLHLNRVRSRCSAEQYDSDLGLYYLRARYYNPITGRFMSRDPKEPQIVDANGNPVDPKALHKYLYANGDPVNHIDPKGKDAFDEYIQNRKFEIEGFTKAEQIGECLDFAYEFYAADLLVLEYRDPVYLEEVLDTLAARCNGAVLGYN
jgi:RHS repeat-associated protein